MTAVATMADQQFGVDIEAREKIERASANLAAHERVCAERWTQAKETMDRLERAVTGTSKVIWGGLCALLSIELAVIGYLANKLF